MNIQTIRKNVNNDLLKLKDQVDKKTYSSLSKDLDKLLAYKEDENGKKKYQSNKKKLLTFSEYLKIFNGDVNTTKKKVDPIVKKERKLKLIENKTKKNYTEMLLNNKDYVVSFYLSLLHEAHSNYNGKTVEHNGIKFKPRSKIDEAYYLSKEVKFESLAKRLYNDCDNFKHMGMFEFYIAEKDVNPSHYQSLFEDFEGYENFITNIKYIINHNSDDNYLILLSHLRIQKVKEAEIDFKWADAYNNDISMFLSCKYINNKVDGLECNAYNSQFVKDNYMINSCGYNLILDLYKKPFDKNMKKFKLTKESLHNIIKPNIPLNIHNNGVKPIELKLFFEKFKLALYIFDIFMNVIFSYEPEKRTHHIDPEICFLIYHNHHYYVLNNDLHVLKEKYKNKVDTNKLTEPNTLYYLKKCDKVDQCKLIYNYEDLKNIIYDKTIEGTIKLYYNKESCLDLWLELYKDLKYEGSILIRDGKLSITNLNLKNINNKNILVETYQETGILKNNPEIFLTDKIFKNYNDKKNKALDNLLNKNYISYYNEQVQKILKTYFISPLVGTMNIPYLNQDETIEIIGLDKNKFYTSILQSFKYLPTISIFDKFVDYNNEPLEDYNLYFVEKTNGKYEYPFQPLSLCFGMNLKDVQCNIISYLRPSHLKNNNSKDIIKDIYYDETLTETMKKNIINHIIGKYNKGKNSKYSTSIFTDESECIYFSQKYDCRTIPIPIDENDNYLYVSYNEVSSQLTEGFKLISYLIYDTSHKQMFDLKKKLENFGIETIRFKTDEIAIRKTDEILLDEFISKNKDMFEYNDLYNSIGKLKINRLDKKGDTLKISQLCSIKRNNLENIYEPIIDEEVNIININDEFDKDEISNIINDNDRLLIKADIAGAGKTSACINFCKLFNKKGLFITPYNALCLDLRKKEMEAITLSKLIGLRLDGEDMKQGISKINVEEYDIIVFDEIYLHDIYNLQHINVFMKRHDKIKYIATGDEYQLSPIDNLNKDINEKEYYNKIIRNMFKNQITLHENKRLCADKDRKKIKDITFKIRTCKTKEDQIKILIDNFKIITNKKDITTVKNVVGLNKTADWVNNYIHKPIDGNKYYIGLELICRKRFKNKSLSTCVNFTYTITNIKDNEITIMDDEEEVFLIDIKYLEIYFKLNYARTCNSYQGMSEDQAITIFDINHWFITTEWIYTAITRATSLDNINIFLGEEFDVNEISKTIDKMIESHINNDLQKNRKIYGTYVNRKWVMDELKKYKKCRICKNYLDISNMESFSIDRKDNNICHSVENCQIICRRCNISKK